MEELAILATTVPDRETAVRLAHAAVEDHLAACAQILGPIRSIYRWQGRIEDTEEWRCHFKTARSAVPALQARLAALHPYDIPEFLVFSPDQASQAYREWALAAVRTVQPPTGDVSS